MMAEAKFRASRSQFLLLGDKVMRLEKVDLLMELFWVDAYKYPIVCNHVGCEFQFINCYAML